MITISKRSNNYVITVDEQQLLDLYNRKQGKNINLTDFYKIQNGINPPLLYDGKPRQYYANYNPSEPQKKLMLETLRQYADIEKVNGKYIIKQIYNEPNLAVDESYTKYLRPLIIDMLYKIYGKSLTPNQTLFIFTMTNNEIAYELNILGDMFHYKVFSKYDNTNEMRNAFYDEYSNVILEGYTGFLLAKVNEDIKQKISYCIDSINLIGLTKREIVLNNNNEPLSGYLDIAGARLDLEEMSLNILNTLKNRSPFMLEYNFNRELRETLEFCYKQAGLIPPPYENCKIAWEFSIDENFRTNSIDIDLDYCRKKLNLNIIHKFIKTNGLSIFEEYRDRQLRGELPEFGADIEELKEYNKYVQIHKIDSYINDMLCIIENIAV